MAFEQTTDAYFLRRLGTTGAATQLPASAQFDLARSPLGDDELESLVDKFRDTPRPTTGWGLSEGLQSLLSGQPKKIPVSDLTALQNNLAAQGYAPPGAEANGVWDPSWYAGFRRFDRDNYEAQRAGKSWYSAQTEAGVRAITNTLPSRVFQGIVGSAKGMVMQTPETFERGGLLGGAAAGAAIGGSVGALFGGIGAAPGAVAGAAIGGAAGFLADLFGSDQNEQDQSGAEKLIDALQPFNEYADQGPKAFFEDLGYVLSAVTMIQGAGMIAKGATAGAAAIQAVRTAPLLDAGGALAEGNVLSVGAAGIGTTSAAAAAPSSLGKALMAPGASRELGVVGTIARAATRKLLPGSVGALEEQMLRYSPVALMHRLGPQIALTGFGGLTKAQLGARMFGGLGQGSAGKFEEAKVALEAEKGRDLTEAELSNLSKSISGSTIENAIADAPRLETGINVPLVGDLADLSAFLLWPEKLLQTGRGAASLAASELKVMGDTNLAPLAHALQHENPGLSLKGAVDQIKENMTGLDVAWLKHDYGLKTEATLSLTRAKLSPEKAFLSNAMGSARADVIRTIKKEWDATGRSKTLERVMSYADQDPEMFTAHLVSLNGRHSGLARLTSWKDANKLSRETERLIEDQLLLVDDGGMILKADALLPDELIALPDEQGFMQAPGRTKKVGARSLITDKAASNVDRMTIVDRINTLERNAKKYKSIADKGTPDGASSIALWERARLAESEAKSLKARLAKIDSAATKRYARVNITPARLDFLDRATIFGKRQEFLDLRKAVLDTVDNPNAHAVARQEMANFVDQLAADGIITDAVKQQAKVGKPGERIAKLLEDQARHAARTIELPEQTMRKFEELGYKPVETGEDVMFPDQLAQMVETSGMGDFTRRAQVWESIGMSTRLRTNEGRAALRRAHEMASLGDVLEAEKIALSPRQAMNRLHKSLAEIGSDAAVGPIARSGPTDLHPTGRFHLPKVDVRDLSPEDVLRAFEDVPGVNEEVARKLYGALRRGAAYGGEAKLLHPLDSARTLGRAMQVNGLSGFSDAIRTWHAEVPLRLSRKAWARGETVYRPAVEFAQSPQRTRVEAASKMIASKTNISEHQRQFGMRMLDSMIDSQVKSGRFASVDEAFSHLDLGYAERYVSSGPEQTLFKLHAIDRSTGELTFLARAFEDNAHWYEESAASLARSFAHGGSHVLHDGTEVSDLDLYAQILAATSPLTTPTENTNIALKVFEMIKRDGDVWPPGVLPNSRKMIDDILSGNTVDKWTEPFRTTKAGLPSSARSRMKVSSFYANLSGELNRVTVDTWMGRLFGIEGVKDPTDFDFITKRITDVAESLTKETGHKWYPAQVQASLWAAAKEEASSRYLAEAHAAEAAGRMGEAGKLRRIARQVSDATSYSGLEDKVKGVVDNLSGLALMQRAEDEVMGATMFGPDFATTMRIFRTGDFSTLIHENAHMLRRLLPDEDVAHLEEAYGVVPQGSPHGISEDLDRIAREYHANTPDVPAYREGALTEYPEVSEERAKRIADAFETQKPTPRERATQQSYKRFVTETMSQYELLKKNGYKLVPWGGEGQPYHGAAEFIKDVRENKRIYYFKTLQDDAFGSGAVTAEQIKQNPLLASSKIKVLDSAGNAYEQTYNDIFRAVHDIFGHAKGGFETGARGEENAWRTHARMYSAEARRAMSTETRGQNSWVNFGPQMRDDTGRLLKKGDKGWLKPEDRAFSEQKVMLLPEEFSQIDEVPRWPVSAEERFAVDAEKYIFQKVVPGYGRGVFDLLRESLGGLYARSRGMAVDTNLVPRAAREVLDKAFADALAAAPDTRKLALVKSLASKQAIGGAVAGGALGAAEGDGPGDIVKGAIGGAVGGMALRKGLQRSYGYLPDYLAKVNTALRYTLSFTFDAGRVTEQNMIAMMKYHLPGMLKPKKYIMASAPTRSPYTSALVSGETAWKHAARLTDEVNGVNTFSTIEDMDRRFASVGMLGFSPREWEIAQTWQLYQRGFSHTKLREAASEIGYYGLSRSAAEMSANFVVFPFSFSKKLIGTLGEFVMQAPGRNLLVHEGMRRYHESEADEKVKDFLDRRAPLLGQLAQISNLAYGISPGRFFLQGLSDQRTNVGKAMQIMSSFFIPSGAATPLAQAAGGIGDLAVHAFTPIVVTGESISRIGGVNNLQDVFRKYVPFVRELDQYFTGDQAAVPSQITALKEGAEANYQFSKYQDAKRIARADYEPLATAMGYTSVDGLMQSNLGPLFAADIQAQDEAAAEANPSGFEMSQSFTNTDKLNERGLLDLSQKPSRSAGEEHILQLAEEIKQYEYMKQVLDPTLVDAILTKVLRDKASQWSSDPRFAELYDRFFLRTYGPIRRVA